MCSYRPSPLSLTLLKDIIDLQFYYSNRVTLENRPLLDKEGGGNRGLSGGAVSISVNFST